MLHVDREVKDSVEAFKRDFARFEALQSGGQPDEIQHAQKELLSQLKTLNWCAVCPITRHPTIPPLVSARLFLIAVLPPTP